MMNIDVWRYHLNNLFACLFIVVAMSILSANPAMADNDRRIEAVLTGVTTEISRPEFIWVGGIEVRLREVYILENKANKALEFMRSLAATGREVECNLTGERLAKPDSQLVGTCFVFGPTDGRKIDLGQRLLERGFARACVEPQAVIAVWPPAYSCD